MPAPHPSAGPGRAAAAEPGAPLWAPTPVITGDGSATLWSPRYRETFRSRHGAVAEARHVFLEGAGVAARLAAGRATRVLEIGLGGATNLALTVAAAAAGGARLQYRTWEAAPLPADAWEAIGIAGLAPADFVAAWLAWRRGWPADGAPGGAPCAAADGPRVAPLERGFRHAAVGIDVVIGDIASTTARAHDAARHPRRVHAVFHDPFSPAANPEAWTPEVLAWLAGRLLPGGILVSYSVRGAIRRSLADAGLIVRKAGGPSGGKREVLIARRPPADEAP